MSDKHRTLTNSRHRSTTARKRSRVSIRWRRTIGSGAHAETYRSGRRTHRPGSLKAPDTHNSKLDSLEAQRKGGKISADHQPGRAHC